MKFNESKFNKHWQDKNLSELGKFQRGKSKHRPRNDQVLFENGIYPLVQTGDIKEANLYIRQHKEAYNEIGLSQSKLWKKNTLCITIAANIAETALLAYPMCFPDSVVGFNAYPHESSELFMHYVFTYIKKSIQNSATGSIQDNINIDYLTQLKFKIPNKVYQDKIASILSSLDDKIELNNRINSELENLAKTIYDYWFVQFDFPDENGKPYKSSGGKMVYNQELKREIPAGWEVGTLQDWIDFKRGISYKSTEIQDTGIPLLNLNSFTLSGKFKPDGTKYFNGSFKEDSRLNYGDLVIAITDVTRNAIIIGKSFIVPDLFDQPPLISCDVASVISKSNFNNYYLEMLFNSEIYHEYIKHFASGTLVLHLDLNGMLWFKTFMPQKRLLDKFAEIKKSIMLKQTINVIENQQLTQLRDWLLPMLMNGQITIK
jgi:type I restriction enzyme S subunit